MSIQTIVILRFGSHLYGTNTPESDLDIKGIYPPSAKEILLQKIAPVLIQSRKKQHGEKNTATDTDYELYSPEKFLLSVAKGQSFALEMLFAPDSALLQPPDYCWQKIKDLSSQL